MPRAYSPRLSTVHLAVDIERLPGVHWIRILGPTRRRGTLLVVFFDSGERLDMTIPQARAWLAAQKGK